MRFTHLIGLFTVGGSMALAAMACDGSSETDTTSAGPGPGSGGSGQGPGPSSASTGTGGIADEGTSCADAVEMTVGANGVFEADGTINPAEDKDYFKFTVGAAGQWFAIFTEANPDDDPNRVDTVVTLLSEDGMTQLAEVDDSFPRYTTDTEIFHRFLAAGTYCLQVQEFSSWNQMAGEGDPTFTYTINALPVDPTVFSGYTLETEPNDTDPQPEPHNYTTDMTTGMVFTRFMGTLDPEADVDIYEITTPPGAMAINIDLTPWGNGMGGQQGYGSTNGPGPISIYNAAGNAVWARVDNQNFFDGLDSMYLTVQENTTYLIQVDRAAGGALGANDFYLLKYSTANQLNPQEEDDIGNANPIPTFHEVTVATPDGAINRHFIGGKLSAGDIDYWSFDVAAPPQPGEELILVCSSRSVGSGVQDMTVTLEKYDATTGVVVTELQTQPEDPNKGVLWSSDAPDMTMGSVMLTDAGPFRVKIEALSVDATVMGRDYLCGIHVGVFPTN